MSQFRLKVATIVSFGGTTWRDIPAHTPILTPKERNYLVVSEEVRDGTGCGTWEECEVGPRRPGTGRRVSPTKD